jgi:glutaredoxin|tara:strand:- start:599 stop:790 length:192 start_codon:yes stop_codon:yes gene_type:complete
MAKEYMKLRKISFSEKNVSTDLDAQVEINKLGFDTTPIIVIGNKIIDGFNAPKIEDAVKHLND